MQIENKISWWSGEWQECSGTCFNGGQGYKKRSVMCVKNRPNEYDDSQEIISLSDIECDASLRPTVIEKCEQDLTQCEHSNLVHWITEEWNRVFTSLVLVAYILIYCN